MALQRLVGFESYKVTRLSPQIKIDIPSKDKRFLHRPAVVDLDDQMSCVRVDNLLEWIDDNVGQNPSSVVFSLLQLKEQLLVINQEKKKSKNNRFIKRKQYKYS